MWTARIFWGGMKDEVDGMDEVDANWTQSGFRRVPQRCMVCQGLGMVARPPWVDALMDEWASGGTGGYECEECLGSGVVWVEVRR